MFSLTDYHYALPPELIAQDAIHPHHDARMMVVDRANGSLTAETIFWHIDEYLWDDRVMFFNDSRVLRSRIILLDTSYTRPDGTKGILAEGEIFYLTSHSDTEFEALVRPGNRFKIGTRFIIWDYEVEVIRITESGRVLRINYPKWAIEDFLTTHGALPLPPYIEYTKEKEADYQTSFARRDWSVAAPTASLHFTEELMDRIKNQKEYLTLHVGLGTFKGIQTADIRDYNIHRERIEINISIFQRIAQLKMDDKKIVAVGTTAMRTLESLPYLWMMIDQDIKNTIDANTCKYWNTLTQNIEKRDWINDINFNTTLSILHFSTSIYITPGYIFRVVNDLVTNFHLGESSLLVLVSAFLGYDATMELYHHAVEQRYRFYSFGDGMYIRGK
jgi:S-adenosylmethionine:tRNA ribosyltransferase-isomerase